MNEGDSHRVPFITARQQIPKKYRHHYDLIEETRGEVIGPFCVLLNSPEVAGRVGHLGTYIRYESTLDGIDRELAIITTACEFTCAFEWAAHEPIAREEGVSEAAIEVLLNQASAETLPETEEIIVRYGRELLHENEVSDAIFEAAKEHFGIQGVTELTVTFGYYSMLANVLNAFEVRPDRETPEFV